MHDSLLAAIVPFNSYACPAYFSDDATVGVIVLPANAVTDFKRPGLFAGQFNTSTRFI
jgi:hypothetical protein